MNAPDCKEFLRSIFWTPPPPEGVTLEPKELPWVKAIKKLPMLDQVYDDSWLDMSTMDLCDLLLQEDAQKVGFCLSSLDNGPDPFSKGMGIFGLADTLLMMYAGSSPLGGMHSYMHALMRCALAHRATILTNSKVEEIIVEHGEAKGVRLADEAPCRDKVILADKAVISATHVKPTFLELIAPKHLDKGFIQRVKDINLNGGSLFVFNLIVKELPKFKGKGGELVNKCTPLLTAFPVDHEEWPEAWGFRFETADAVIVISGDARPSNSVVEACSGCDLLVHEVYSDAGFAGREPGWQRYHASAHTSASQLAELATRAGPVTLVLYHQLLWGSTPKELVAEVKAGYAGRVVYGRDLDVFSF